MSLHPFLLINSQEVSLTNRREGKKRKEKKMNIHEAALQKLQNGNKRVRVI